MIMFPLLIVALLIAFAVLVVSMTSMGSYAPALCNATTKQISNVTIAVDAQDSEEIAIPGPTSGQVLLGIWIYALTTYTAGAAENAVANAVHLDSAISSSQIKTQGETYRILNSATYRWNTIIQQIFTRTAITTEALANFGAGGADTCITKFLIPFKSHSNASIIITSGPVTAAYAADVTQSTVYTFSAMYGEDTGGPDWGIDTVILPAINGAGQYNEKIKACLSDGIAYAGLTEAQFTSTLITDADGKVVINDLGGVLLEKATQQGWGLARITNSLWMPLPGGARLGPSAYMALTTGGANTVSVAYTRLGGSGAVPAAGPSQRSSNAQATVPGGRDRRSPF